MNTKILFVDDEPNVLSGFQRKMHKDFPLDIALGGGQGLSHANESNLPRVLLIGDSIARDYFPEVETNLAGKAYVASLATSRSVSDPVLLQEIALLLDNTKFDVIHFNNGMHGWQHSEAQAIAAMSLKVTMPGILRRFGYRSVLISNTIVLGLLIALFATSPSEMIRGIHEDAPGMEWLLKSVIPRLVPPIFCQSSRFHLRIVQQSSLCSLLPARGCFTNLSGF
jgi:hypothetical protein